MIILLSLGELSPLPRPGPGTLRTQFMALVRPPVISLAFECMVCIYSSPNVLMRMGLCFTLLHSQEGPIRSLRIPLIDITIHTHAEGQLSGGLAGVIISTLLQAQNKGIVLLPAEVALICGGEVWAVTLGGLEESL